MLHFLKYCFITLFLFAFLNLFRSNMTNEVSIAFQMPLIWQWQSPPISLNYLMLMLFCVGILFSAAIGAFRVMELHAKNREIKTLRRLLKESKPTISHHEDNHPPLAGD